MRKPARSVFAIVVGGEEILPDARRLARVGGDELEPAPAFRPQHHRAAGVGIGVSAAERPQIGRGRHRRGVEDELHVGQGGVGPAFQERHAAGRQIRRDAFAAQIGAEKRRHDAVEPHGA